MNIPMTDIIEVRLGIWHETVTLYFQPDKIPAVPARVEIDPSYGKVYLVADENGTLPELDPYYAELEGEFPYRVVSLRSDADKEVARCALTRIWLSYDPVSGGYVCELPPNHKLPWPHARECSLYDKQEELMSECRLRRASANALKQFVPVPPGYVVKALTPEMRMELFR